MRKQNQNQIRVPRMICAIIFIFILSFALISCGAPINTIGDSDSVNSDINISEDDNYITFTDALERSVTVKKNPVSVVSLHGSYAEAWSLAGGVITGATRDVIDENRNVNGDNIIMVGTNRDPNLEQILALAPDFILLSADMDSQLKLNDAFADIPHAYFSVDSWQDYLNQMAIFCDITGRPDLYRQNAASVENQIQEILLSIPESDNPPTVLLIRAFSSGVKVIGANNQTGAILKDLGADNLADRDNSPLQDLSLEIIIQEDPDFIFITTMGDESAAREYLENGLFQNPAWNGLSAVQNERVMILPKELFHYKPNNRWGESYAYLEKILYGS